MRFRLDASWTPYEIMDDVTTWFDASDQKTITLAGSSVAQILDKGIYGNHLVQSTASLQPTYVEDARNGLNMIYGDGTEDMRTVVGDYNYDDMFICTVFANISNTDNYDSVFAMNGNGNDWQICADIPGNETTWRGYFISNTTGLIPFDTVVSPANTWQMLEIDHNTDETSIDLYKNGSHVNTGTYGIWDSTAIQLHLFVNRGGTVYIESNFGEIIMCERIHREKVEGYMAWKWGLENELPSNHPYKLRRPMT